MHHHLQVYLILFPLSMTKLQSRVAYLGRTQDLLGRDFPNWRYKVKQNLVRPFGDVQTERKYALLKKSLFFDIFIQKKFNSKICAPLRPLDPPLLIKYCKQKGDFDFMYFLGVKSNLPVKCVIG